MTAKTAHESAEFVPELFRIEVIVSFNTRCKTYFTTERVVTL